MLYKYEQGTGCIEALQFLLRIKNQDVAFSLPVHWRRFQRVLELQQVRRWDEEEYVYRVAWRNMRDWVMPQLALYETVIVEMPQVFLPFATDANGQTLYEHVQTNSRFLLVLAMVSITSSATFVNSRITRHAQTTSRLQSESYLTILSHHASYRP